MRKRIIIIGWLIIMYIISCNTSAVTVDHTVEYSTQQNGDYTNYTFASEQYYEIITVNSTNISFKPYNTYGVNFNITSPGSNIKITFGYIVNCTDGDDYVYSINFTKESYGINLKTYYNLTQSLNTSTKYTLYINSTYNNTYNTDGNGNVSFNTSSGFYGNVLLSRTCKLRVNSGAQRYDMIPLSNTVITIIGIALIITALMLIIGILYNVIR